MTVTIQPGRAVGTVAAPPSKSMAHRLLICAGLAKGASRISGLSYNEDILATLDCLRALGISCRAEGDRVTVEGGALCPGGVLDCRESGSTLRFFIPLALLSGREVTFRGSEKLLSRPLSVYEPLCATFRRENGSLTVAGSLCSTEYSLPGDVSSQFISGLLFALPLVQGDSRIHITTPIESKSYIDLTLQALASFGVAARWESERTLFIPGGQQYHATQVAVEGDYSGAAFYGAMNALGSQVEVVGLKPESLQGDRVYPQLMERLCRGFCQIDISDCPDLGPALFAVAAANHGARFTGTRRLKFKESDRSEAMAEELAAFGAKVLVEENAVTVEAAAFHAPDRILQSHNDHRIVMALAALLLRTGGSIAGAEAVNKSFPDFFRKLQQLGIRLETQEAD